MIVQIVYQRRVPAPFVLVVFTLCIVHVGIRACLTMAAVVLLPADHDVPDVASSQHCTSCPHVYRNTYEHEHYVGYIM